jgi:hypothetical protein
MGGVDGRTLSLWEYEAMLTEHNDRLDPNGPPIASPSPEKVKTSLARLAADPRFTH